MIDVSYNAIGQQYAPLIGWCNRTPSEKGLSEETSYYLDVFPNPNSKSSRLRSQPRRDVYVDSCIDSKEKISRDQWVVYLIRDTLNDPLHTVIMLEGVNETGQVFIDRYHLTRDGHVRIEPRDPDQIRTEIRDGESKYCYVANSIARMGSKGGEALREYVAQQVWSSPPYIVRSGEKNAKDEKSDVYYRMEYYIHTSEVGWVYYDYNRCRQPFNTCGCWCSAQNCYVWAKSVLNHFGIKVKERHFRVTRCLPTYPRFFLNGQEHRPPQVCMNEKREAFPHILGSKQNFFEWSRRLPPDMQWRLYLARNQSNHAILLLEGYTTDTKSTYQLQLDLVPDREAIAIGEFKRVDSSIIALNITGKATVNIRQVPDVAVCDVKMQESTKCFSISFEQAISLLKDVETDQIKARYEQLLFFLPGDGRFYRPWQCVGDYHCYANCISWCERKLANIGIDSPTHWYDSILKSPMIALPDPQQSCHLCCFDLQDKSQNMQFTRR